MTGLKKLNAKRAHLLVHARRIAYLYVRSVDDDERRVLYERNVR